MSLMNWVRACCVVAAAILLANGCGSSSGSGSGADPGGGTTSAAWTNTAMQTLVAGRCASSGCHDGSRSPNYKGVSESKMKSDSKALSRVQSGSMPQGSALSAADKATFVNFYK